MLIIIFELLKSIYPIFMVYFKSYDTKLTSFIWKWFLFLLFFLSSHLCFTQITPQPAFRNLSTNDGLPSSEVYEIFEDRQGFIWFATDNGISKFNGYTFENYSAEEGLSNNVVFHFFEDKNGRVWMNSLSGELFYLEEGRVHPYIYNDIIESHKEKIKVIEGFFFNEQGDLYLSMRSYGILVIDHNGNDQVYGLDNYGPTIMSSDGYSLPANVSTVSTLSIEEREPYVELSLDQIFNLRFIEQDKHVNIQVPFEVKKSRSSDIKLINFGDESYLLHFRCNIFYIKDKVVRWAISEDIDCSPPCFGKTEKGEIFFSNSNRKGIRIYENIEALRKGQYRVLLDDYFISNVFLDANNSYWFSTIGNGVFYSSDLNIKLFSGTSNGEGDNITSFSIFNDSIIYYANQNGDFYELNHKSNIQRALPKTQQKLPILNIEFDDNTEKLWVTHPIKVFDGQKWNDLNYSKAAQRNFLTSTTKIKKSSDGERFWGTGSDGFMCLDLKSEEIVFTSKESSLQGRAFSVFENSEKRVFVSNTKGFFELKKDSLFDLGSMHPTFNLRVEDIVELSDGTMVLGTKGGGVAFWKDEEISLVTVKDGLYSNMIEHLAIDQTGNIWVGTLNGLNLVKPIGLDRKEFQVYQYGTAHGLPSAEISDMSSQGDTIWLATPKGLVLFYKDQNVNGQKNEVFLEQFMVNDRDIKDEYYEFQYDENNIRLEYLLINVKLRGQIQYRYRLDSQSKWQYTEERAANFFDLPPGGYFFEVQAQDENGKWTPSLIIEFLIKPPFWERAWFITIGILVILGLIWLAVQRYIARIRRDNEIEKEMQSLKASALQAQMNPHFVFNCLNAIQSFIARKESEKATRYLARFATLVRNNLNASINKVVTLDEEIQTIENYLSFEKMRFQKKIDYKVEVDPNLQIYDIEIPPLMTLPYVENAVIHGLLKSPRPGQLAIKYFKDNLCLIIEIQDNGLGIFQTQKIKSTQKLDGIHKSIGMSISKKMQELFNEGLEEKDLVIEELKNENGEVEGTRIRLRVKMKKTSN